MPFVSNVLIACSIYCLFILSIKSIKINIVLNRNA